MTMVDVEVQRRATAYHEAAHAVVGCEVGWWITPEGIEIGEREYTGLRCWSEDLTGRNLALVSLAGWNAEHKWHGLGQEILNDEELIDILSDVRDGVDEDEIV